MNQHRLLVSGFITRGRFAKSFERRPLGAQCSHGDLFPRTTAGPELLPRRSKFPALFDHGLQLKPGTGSLRKISRQFLYVDPLLPSVVTKSLNEAMFAPVVIRSRNAGLESPFRTTAYANAQSLLNDDTS